MSEIMEIALSSGPKYSPNLTKWLARNGRPYGAPSVFKDYDGVRWIGWIDDGWFIGCRLGRVLNKGAKAEVGCWTFPITDLTRENDFWKRYRDIGRCAIDEAHAIGFIGDETRWAVDGDTRSCLWCGDHTQVKRRWTETEERSRWEPVATLTRATGDA